VTQYSRAAFTLVELMVVIAIIGVLLALLAPSVSSAWELALMTKCQINLSSIWKAQNLRRADKDLTIFTVGGVWPAMLAPYLEHSAEVFRCPKGPERPELTPMVTTEADRYAVAGTDMAQQNSFNEAEEAAKGFTLSDLTFRMSAKSDCTVDKQKYSKGQYLGTVFLDSGYGIQKKDLGGGKTYIGVDDRQFFDDKNLGGVDYKDVQIIVQMDGSYIRSIEFSGTDIGTGGSYKIFRYEVWLAGEMLSDDFVRDIGMVVGSDNRSGGGSGSTGGNNGTSTLYGQPGSLNELAAIKSFDYGLNKGTYQVLDRWTTEVDPRLFLILDYGKSVANYSNKQPDAWSLYFTAPEPLWMANSLNVSFLKPGESWMQYTALRHFGKANVLFCDGHIESLSANELAETSPLWGASAR
jgi:prepilin-type N-terminal cleavage/methylation domain-containing protein/prepilin-type processing-associated H-X9-DG protein